ncbi:MAG: glycosyltransferase family 2 protein, partial [Gemmataceae bacterium]
RSLERFLRAFTLERGVALGACTATMGLILAAYSVATWARAGLGAMDPTMTMRIAIPSVTLMLAGAELFFASFLLGLIDVHPVRGA